MTLFFVPLVFRIRLYYAFPRKYLSGQVIIMNEQTEWGLLSAEEKKIRLYFQQKEVLDNFLERNAITQAQYDKSLGDMTEKMGMRNYLIMQKE